MTSDQILAFFHDSPLGVASRNVQGVFSIGETVHFIGLCLLIGAILVFDLRILGVLRRGTLKSALSYTHIAAFGLALNAASGLLLFSNKPSNYVSNPAFLLKMSFLLLALLNVVWFETVERKKLLAIGDGEVADLGARIAAGLSLVLWLGVIVLGRWLPVTSLGGG